MKRRIVQVLFLPLILCVACAIGLYLGFTYAVDGEWDEWAIKEVKDIWRRMKK